MRDLKRRMQALEARDRTRNQMVWSAPTMSCTRPTIQTMVRCMLQYFRLAMAVGLPRFCSQRLPCAETPTK